MPGFAEAGKVVTTCILFVRFQVFELMKKQEETRQAEEKTKTQEFAVMEAQQETVGDKYKITAKIVVRCRTMGTALHRNSQKKK